MLLARAAGARPLQRRTVASSAQPEGGAVGAGGWQSRMAARIAPPMGGAAPALGAVVRSALFSYTGT
jgi:hypothetical protein